MSKSTEIVCVAADPKNPRQLYARDDFWVYTSRDGGTTWKKNEQDLDVTGTINGIFAMAVTTATPPAAFTSVYERLWRSVDGGATFVRSDAGLPATARVQSLVSSSDGATLWAGTEDEGVWRSADGGAHWAESRGGLGEANVQALLVDAADPKTLYAAVWNQGVYRSRDAGRTWSRLGDAPPHPDLVSLAADPSSPAHLLVGTGGGSVWRFDTAAPASEPAPAKAKAKAAAKPAARPTPKKTSG